MLTRKELDKRVREISSWPDATHLQKITLARAIEEIYPAQSNGSRGMAYEHLQMLGPKIAMMDDYLNSARKSHGKGASATEAVMTALEEGPKTFADILIANPHLSPNTIRQTMSGLSMGGAIERIERGIYALPGTTPLPIEPKRPTKFKAMEEMLTYFFEDNTAPAPLEFIRKWGIDNGSFNKGLDALLFELNRLARIGDIICDVNEDGVTYWSKEL